VVGDEPAKPPRSSTEEELREALIDLERSRQHERQLRIETEGLLEGLGVLAGTRSTAQVFNNVAEVLRRFVPFDQAFMLLAISETHLECIHSTSPIYAGLSWRRGDMLSRVLNGKTTAVFDVGQVPEWAEQCEAARANVASALHTPLRTQARSAVLVFVHSSPAFFIKSHVRLLERFAPLTNHALASIEYLTYYNPLTGLPNRNSLSERFAWMTAHARRNGSLLALLFVDLDRFKQVNDSYGHNVGDALLKVVAERLQSAIRDTDAVAHQGGDEFVVLLSDIERPDYVSAVAAKMLAAIALPIDIGDQKHYISSSIGASVYPSDGEEFDTLVKNADIAMYRVKKEGGNALQFYTKEMSTRVVERAQLEKALHQALEEQEFQLHYQPKVDLASGRISGLEALIRWPHPQLGMVMPDRFIPLAEDTGLIGSIGAWVLETACRRAKAWHDAGYVDLSISVNLSARQLRQQNVPELVGRVLRTTGLPPTSLELELTESALLQDDETLVEALLQLKALGTVLSLDDFGTGYSSLSHLRRFPIDIIKVDRSFIRDVTIDRGDASLTAAIIAIARSLNLRTVAEGVETQDQLLFLRAHRCDAIQGYYFSRPLPADAITNLLKEDKRLAT
jgi:diguanylate cyclase (GGDEF)-like protein